MTPIQESTSTKAWVKALVHLKNQEGWVDYNIILSIKEPCLRDDEAKKLELKVDTFLSDYGTSLDTVAQTIFPASQYRNYGVEGVYKKYPNEIYPKIKGKRWGTYAHRLVCANNENPAINPLKDLVEKMKNQLQGNGAKRACYEISLNDPSFDINLYRNDKDRRRIMGGPCLSHLSFKINHRNNKVNLTAIYRSHYYIERGLGNLRGLGFLMKFVAEQVGRDVGELIVHSSYAKIDHSEKEKWNKGKITAFLKEIL